MARVASLGRAKSPSTQECYHPFKIEDGLGSKKNKAVRFSPLSESAYILAKGVLPARITSPGSMAL
jgi:hypothetical protein